MVRTIRQKRRSKNAGSSPDSRSVLGLQKVLSARDAECRIPGVDIPQRSDDAKRRRRVRISCELISRRVVALLHTPRLSIGQEETLVAVQTVENGRRLVV